MKSLVIGCIAVAAAVSLSARAQTQTQGQAPTGQQDTTFITQAAQANLAEEELGKLGAKNSQNTQVQQFSKDLEKDHKSANKKLKTIAASDGVKFPRSPSPEEQQEITKLQGLSGTQFDQQFATTALQQHAKTLQLFQQEAQQGQDQAVKQYAQTMVPALEHHLSMAKNVAQQVGVSQSTVSSILSQYPEAMGGGMSPTGQQQGTGSSKSGY